MSVTPPGVGKGVDVGLQSGWPGYILRRDVFGADFLILNSADSDPVLTLFHQVFGIKSRYLYQQDWFYWPLLLQRYFLVSQESYTTTGTSNKTHWFWFSTYTLMCLHIYRCTQTHWRRPSDMRSLSSTNILMQEHTDFRSRCSSSTVNARAVRLQCKLKWAALVERRRAAPAVWLR